MARRQWEKQGNRTKSKRGLQTNSCLCIFSLEARLLSSHHMVSVSVGRAAIRVSQGVWLLEGRSQEIKVWTGPVFRWLPFSRILTASPVCVCVSVLISSHKDTRYFRLRSAQMTFFYLDNLFKGPMSKYSCIMRYQELQIQHMNLGGHKSAPICPLSTLKLKTKII